MKKTTFFCWLLACAAPIASTAQTARELSVGELFSMLENGNRTLRSLKTGTDVAEKAVAEAKSQRLPDISAQLSATYNGNVLMTDRDFGNATGISQPHFGNSFAIEAQQTVYAGGAINAGIRLAELQRQQSDNAVDMARNQQRFVALGQYLDLYRTDNGIKVYNSNIALTEKLIDDIKAKHTQGMALKNDVTRYELQMEDLRLGLRRLQDQRRITNHQLCNSLGLATDTYIVPDTTVIAESMDGGTEAQWQSRAAASSPALRQSATGVQMAEQQLKLAKSELLPKVAVFAADNFSGPFTYDLPPIDKNFNIWYVGVGVKYSLSSLFKANKSVRRAKANVAMSRDNHAVAVESTDNGVQQAYTLYRQSLVDLRTKQKSRELATQNYTVVNERYLNQLALITDMVDASNVKLNAELQEVDARIGIAYAYYKMKYMAGEL